MYRREVGNVICMKETRRTGRLTKCVTVLDVNFASIALVRSRFCRLAFTTDPYDTVGAV